MPEVIFTGPAGRIEGRYHPARQKNAPIAIVLHPHPQFGGTMNHQIIYQLYYAFVHRGFSALRFNFRGVGRSQGSFDHGTGELSDAAAALDWAQTINPEAKSCWIAGFSFGAWIGMQLLMRRPEIEGFISICPPANLYDFSFLAPCPSSGLIIHGDKDAVVPPKDVTTLVDKLKTQKGIVIEQKVVPGANHFFDGKVEAAAHLDLRPISTSGSRPSASRARPNRHGCAITPPRIGCADAGRVRKRDRQAVERAHRQIGEGLRFERIAPTSRPRRRSPPSPARAARASIRINVRIARAAAGDDPGLRRPPADAARCAPTACAVSADSVAAPSATEKSGRPILAKAKRVAVERLRAA